MKKLSKNLEYDQHMDVECVDLCNALNSLPGIVTLESCCGHGCGSYHIFFRVSDSKKGLFFLTRCVDKRYWKYGYLWNISLSVSDTIHEGGELPTVYLLSSNSIIGEDAYAQAYDLIDNMNHHLNHVNFMKEFNLDINDFVCEEDLMIPIKFDSILWEIQVVKTDRKDSGKPILELQWGWSAGMSDEERQEMAGSSDSPIGYKSVAITIDAAERLMWKLNSVLEKLKNGN